MLTVLGPVILAVVQSFTRINRAGLFGEKGVTGDFAGFANYAQALSDSNFLSAIGRVLLFGVVQVPVMTVFATILALLLESASARWPSFFRAAYFLPYGIPGVIATILWSFLYVPGLSPIIDIGKLVGLDIDFLGPNAVLWSIANIVTWTYTGYNMLIIIAQLKSIPSEIYEAAKVDGASPLRIAASIQLPLIRPALILSVVFSIIGTLQLFVEPLVLQHGVAGDRHRVHAEPERLQQRLQLQRLRHRVGRGRDHRGGGVRAVVRLPRLDQPEGAVMTTRNTGWTIVVTALLTIVAIYFLVPVYWVVVAATKSSGDLFTTPGFWFGRTMELWNNVTQVFTASDHIYLLWLLNSVIYAVGGALVATYLAAAGGYALAKYEFRGRNLVFGTVLGGVLVPSTATALPLFLLFSKLGLTNTYWGVLLPSMVSPFGLYLCRIYASATVEDSVLESGRLDGAGELRIFHTLVLRSMAPALVTVFLFQLVGIWNNFLLPLIMLADDKLYPITLGLNAWRSQVDRSPEFYPLTIGGLLVSVIPLAIAMVFLQRYWRGGLTDGSVKG